VVTPDMTDLLLRLPCCGCGCKQIGDPEKMKAACASPRACVASFPTTTVEGILFAWLESGPEAEREAAAQQPYIMPEQVGSSRADTQAAGCSSCGSSTARCCGVIAGCSYALLAAAIEVTVHMHRCLLWLVVANNLVGVPMHGHGDIATNPIHNVHDMCQLRGLYPLALQLSTVVLL